MKQIITLVLLIAVCYCSYNRAALADNPEVRSIEKEIRTKKQELKNSLLSLNYGSTLLNTLKSLKAKLIELFNKTGVTGLLKELQAELKKECDFIARDPEIKLLSQRSDETDQQIENYRQTAGFKKVLEKENQLKSLRTQSVLTYEQGQQVKKLQQEIKNLVAQDLVPLFKQKRTIDMAISQRLRSFTNRIANIATRIKNALTNNTLVHDFKYQLDQIRNRSDLQTTLNPERREFEADFKDLENLFDELFSVQQPCIEVGIGQFVSPAQYLESTNEGIIGMLMDSNA